MTCVATASLSSIGAWAAMRGRARSSDKSPGQTSAAGRQMRSHLFGSVSGRQALASGGGRVVAPVAAGFLITSTGYPSALAGVALCAAGAGALLLLAERAHTRLEVTATAG